jgi:hypothetical protein
MGNKEIRSIKFDGEPINMELFTNCYVCERHEMECGHSLIPGRDPFHEHFCSETDDMIERKQLEIGREKIRRMK